MDLGHLPGFDRFHGTIGSIAVSLLDDIATCRHGDTGPKHADRKAAVGGIV